MKDYNALQLRLMEKLKEHRGYSTLEEAINEWIKDSSASFAVLFHFEYFQFQGDKTDLVDYFYNKYIKGGV